MAAGSLCIGLQSLEEGTVVRQPGERIGRRLGRQPLPGLGIGDRERHQLGKAPQARLCAGRHPSRAPRGRQDGPPEPSGRDHRSGHAGPIAIGQRVYPQR